MKSYRVLKRLPADTAEHISGIAWPGSPVYVQLDEAGEVRESYVTAQQIGEKWGEGEYLIWAADESYRQPEVFHVASKKRFVDAEVL